MGIGKPLPEPTGLSEAKRRLLAQRLKGLSIGGQDLGRIQPRPAGARTPISPDQYRLWLHASMQPDLPIYNEPIVIRRLGRLDLHILEASLDRFLDRHEAWRTSFVIEHEDVLQVVHPKLSVHIEFTDLAHLPENERELEARRLATTQALLPIRLDRPPLFRVQVVRIAPGDHRLYMVLHHIIFDGISIQKTFLPELAAIYAALESGIEPGLPAVRLQYSDYAIWRQQQLDSGALQAHIDYWRTVLADELPVLRLPTDRSRPALMTQRGAMEQFKISREVTNALREMGQARGATLYMTLFAAFNALLFRYSGQEDIIVGGAADGRRRPELDGMVGYLLDTFAIRTRPSSKLPFSDYLAQVKTVVLGALDAADVPFEQIVQVLGMKRDPSHHPVFQTFFSFQPQNNGFPPGWDMPPMNITVGAAKFDIYLEVDERPTHTAARIIYSTDLFDAETIRRMYGHWLTLLDAVLKNPDCALGDLPLLTSEELDRMLVRWNCQTRPLPATTMHGLVEEQARSAPDNPAVRFENTAWTYAQLNQRAETLAAHLRRSGAGPGTLVALYMDRSQNLIAGLIAVLKTGAAYLPLDPAAPRARTMLCLEDAAPVAVLTERSLEQDLPPGGGAVVIVENAFDDGRESPGGCEVAAPGGRGMDAPNAATPSDIAYVIHTSGSTGRPKAVEIRHSSVVNLLLSVQREPGFTASDTLLAVSTVSFDIAALELFLPLISGGQVVIASRATALDPWRMASLIQSSGCTVMQATPATWSALLASDWKGSPGLRVLCGGEALSRVLADRLLALGVELWNVYGPTETTIWSTIKRVVPGAGPVPVGRPIANTTAYILDQNQQPVPIGVPGELYIGGAGVAAGYRGQPQLTAEKFVTPAVAKGERLYRTGDYAVYRAGGVIECLGRADNQVKVRGYRIELEEVELHLSAHPQVVAAAARVWPDSAGGNRLIAYLVGKNGPPPQLTEIREFLQSRLPEYMIPSAVIAMESMPLTQNGKFDRKALPAPDLSRRDVLDLPQTKEELKLAGIWAELLGVDRVARGDNFFDLGGHSLLMVRLFARINKEFKTDLPITAIFDTQTLSGLAQLLHNDVRVSSLVPVQTSGTRPPLFMVHSYLIYYALSSALGADQPFYGLRELPEDADESLEERAQRYAADIKSVQEKGPYRVAGWCASGPLAAEIARQLILAGDELALLALFDSTLPRHAKEVEAMIRSTPRAAAFRRKLVYHKAQSRALSAAGRMTYFLSVLRRTAKRKRDQFYIRHWNAMSRLSRELNIPLPQFMFNSSLRMLEKIEQFRPQRMPVRLTLIRASDSRDPDEGSISRGWEQIAELGVDVRWAPGDHETMFRGNNLKVTAQLVKELLAAADPAASVPAFEEGATARAPLPFGG